MLLPDPCTISGWKSTTDPAPPLGPSMPCARTSPVSSAGVSAKSAGSTCCADRGDSERGPRTAVPCRCDPGMNTTGPLNSVTSSRKTATFTARGAGMPSTTCHTTKSWCQDHSSPPNAAFVLILNWWR